MLIASLVDADLLPRWNKGCEQQKICDRSLTPISRKRGFGELVFLRLNLQVFARKIKEERTCVPKYSCITPKHTLITLAGMRHSIIFATNWPIPGETPSRLQRGRMQKKDTFLHKKPPQLCQLCIAHARSDARCCIFSPLQKIHISRKRLCVVHRDLGG